jgi:signal transduction histidine kinase
MSEHESNRRSRRKQNLAARLQSGPMNVLAQMHEGLVELGLRGVESAAELSSRVDELTGLAEWVIDDINEAIRVLSTDRFYDHRHQPGSDLFTRLRQMCSAFSEESGIRCDFSVDAEHVAFNSLVGEVVFRSIGELLNNVERHAHASAVIVSSALGAGGAAIFEVEDDGIGLPGVVPGSAIRVDSGFGLWNVDLCLREFGGFLEFSVDHGLKVRIVLPGQHAIP